MGIFKRLFGSKKTIDDNPQDTENLPLPPFKDKSTEDVQEVVASLCDEAINSIPIIPQSRVEFEYKDLAPKWGSLGLSEITLPELRNLVQQNLERDKNLPRFNQFQLKVIPDQYCAQVSSLFGGSTFSFTPYRIWRTSDAFWFCGHRDAIQPRHM